MKFFYCLICVFFVLSGLAVANADINDFVNPGNSLFFSDHQFIGKNTDDYAGVSVSSAGDVNGDGICDILIGAPYSDSPANTNCGKTYLIFGNSATNNKMVLSQADHIFIGEGTNDFSGYRVSAAGDVNNDGYGDILIGAYGNDDIGADSGKVYLMSGYHITNFCNKNVYLGNADLRFFGEAGGDWAGFSICCVGDIDNDIYPDIVISAPYNDQNGADSGKVYIFKGMQLKSRLSTPLWAPERNISLTSADWIYYGESTDDRIGWEVSSAGDVNADGTDDVLVGASSYDDGANTNAGSTYLIANLPAVGSSSSIATADCQFIGETFDEESGYSVSSAGDVDGDGMSDILIGCPQYNVTGTLGTITDAGRVCLFLGSNITNNLLPVAKTYVSNADYIFEGENSYDWAGYRVAYAGDVDGDLLDDVFIGSYFGGNSRGRAYLIKGAFLGGGITSYSLGSSDYIFTGEDVNDCAGTSIASCGDINDDGFSDILIGAYLYDGQGSNEGSVYLIYGGN